jgi:hypothetical protein
MSSQGAQAPRDPSLRSGRQKRARGDKKIGRSGRQKNWTLGATKKGGSGRQKSRLGATNGGLHKFLKQPQSPID